MVATFSSSSINCNVNARGVTNSVKFVCSYGGKILPRHQDGQLRYVGGETRILSVDRSMPLMDLLVKLGELCGSTVSLRCQLPEYDLDALVSITSEEDIRNLLEEYDRASLASSAPVKIKAFLSPSKSTQRVSPPASVTSPSSSNGSRTSPLHRMAVNRCVQKYAGPKQEYYPGVPHGHSYVHLVHNGNYWQ